MGCVLLVVVVALFSLSGCKYSDVLTQRLEDPDLGTLDENEDPVYSPNPESDLVLDLAELNIDESDIVDTQVQVMPHYDPNAPDNGPTTQRVKSTQTPHDEEASEGDEQEEEQEGDREGAGSGEERGSETQESGDSSGTPKEEETDKEEEPEQQPEEQQSGEEQEQEDDSSSSDENQQEEQNEESNGDEENDDPQTEDENNNIPEDDNQSDTGDEKGSDEVKDEQSNNQSENNEDEAGQGGPTVIVDPEQGTNTETAKGTVAAVGEYATITQMLGGAGALAAADESWLAARQADGCFAGELDLVVPAFSGGGTETGDCDVDALIENAKPSVLLWDGKTPALSNADRNALENAGIAIQVVPTLGSQSTEDYTVTQAVQEVANVLSGAGGLSYDPVDVARKYLNYHDEMLRASYNGHDGGAYSYKVTDSAYQFLYQDTPLSGLNSSTTNRITTVFVDDIMVPGHSTAKVSQNAYVSEGTLRLLHDGMDVDVSDGVALSVASDTNSYMLIDYYLQLAGVVNNAYDAAKPEGQGRRYIIMPGTTNAFGTSDRYASRSTGTALFYNSGDGTVLDNWHCLGNADFPAIITANADIAKAINDSASNPDGLYRMDESYRIMVVPSGIAGSWSEGHIDSFLLARWAFGLYDAKYLNDVKQNVTDFYSGLLRCANWEGNGAVQNWDFYYVTDSG